MKPNLLTRIFAFLLVPSLIGDPFIRTQSLPLQFPFVSQALAPSLEAAFRDGPVASEICRGAALAPNETGGNRMAPAAANAETPRQELSRLQDKLKITLNDQKRLEVELRITAQPTDKENDMKLKWLLRRNYLRTRQRAHEKIKDQRKNLLSSSINDGRMKIEIFGLNQSLSETRQDYELASAQLSEIADRLIAERSERMRRRSELHQSIEALNQHIRNIRSRIRELKHRLAEDKPRTAAKKTFGDAETQETARANMEYTRKLRDIGQKLRTHRMTNLSTAHLTIAQFADLADLSSYVELHHYEYGDWAIPENIAVRLARILGIDYREFLAPAVVRTTADQNLHERRFIDKEKIWAFSERGYFFKAIDYFNEFVLQLPVIEWTHIWELWRLLKGEPENEDLRLKQVEILSRLTSRLYCTDASPLLATYTGSLLDLINEKVHGVEELIQYSDVLYKDFVIKQILVTVHEQTHAGAAWGHHRLAWLLVNFFRMRNGFGPIYFKSYQDYGEMRKSVSSRGEGASSTAFQFWMRQAS
jgi:hypothetical protein